MPAQDPRQTVMTLWGSMCMSHLVLLGVGWAQYQRGVESVSPDNPLRFIWLPGMIAVLAAPLVERNAARKALAKVEDANLMVQAAMTPLLFGWALREAGALFALVGLLVTGNTTTWALLAGVAFASTLLAAPNQARIRAWRDEARRDQPPS